jgi:hypothetical protein
VMFFTLFTILSLSFPLNHSNIKPQSTVSKEIIIIPFSRGPQVIDDITVTCVISQSSFEGKKKKIRFVHRFYCYSLFRIEWKRYKERTRSFLSIWTNNYQVKISFLSSSAFSSSLSFVFNRRSYEMLLTYEFYVTE